MGSLATSRLQGTNSAENVESAGIDFSCIEVYTQLLTWTRELEPVVRLQAVEAGH